MKKAILLVVLSFMAFYTLAEEKTLDVNGSFEKVKNLKGKLIPSAWMTAHAGNIKIVNDAADGKNAILWKCPKNKKIVYISTKERFKCKPGDSIFISFSVKGKGKLRVSIFAKHGKFSGRTCDNNFTIDSKDFKKYEIEMEIPESKYKGYKISAFSPALLLFANGKLTIDNLKVSFEKNE